MSRIFDWLMLLLIVAIVLLMVRPGSLGPLLVEKVGKSMVDLVQAATGGGTWGNR